MSTDLWWDMQGEGPGMVLMHSALSDSRSWAPLVQRLRRSHKVVRFDARGFGKSPRAAGQFDMLADLLGVMGAAGLERAHLVGNSMGADVAIGAALFHPDAVSSLTLIGPGLDLETTPEESARLMSQWRSARASGDVDVAVDAARALWLASDEQALRTREIVTDPRSFEAMQLATMADFNLADIGRISVPALIIVGGADDRAILDSAAVLASTIAKSKLVTVEAARHLPQEDKPDRVANVLEEFVSTVAG